MSYYKSSQTAGGLRNYEKYSLNKVRTHNTKETTNHFLTKAYVFKLLTNAKHDVMTEYEFFNNKVCDVLDLDDKIVYEIETAKLTPAKRKQKQEDFSHVKDVIILDIKGKTINECMELVERKIIDNFYRHATQTIK